MLLIADVPGLMADGSDTLGYAGGGAMPMNPLPSRAIALTAAGLSAHDLARRLRLGTPGVVGRIERDRVLIDLRTVSDDETAAVAAAIRAAVRP